MGNSISQSKFSAACGELKFKTEFDTSSAFERVVHYN